MGTASIQYHMIHEIWNVFHVHPKINCLSMDHKAQTTEVINLNCEPCETPRKSLYPTPYRNVSKTKIACFCFTRFFSISSIFNESYNVEWEKTKRKFAS